MPTIIHATANPHKVEELRAIFASLGADLHVLGLKDLPGHEKLHEPEEIGRTCEENARIKALSYAQQIAALGPDDSILRADESSTTSLPTPLLFLADDSGIEIDALRLPDGTPRPGVISSHYSSDGHETRIGRAERDAANNARVLRELSTIPNPQRAARFICCMCLVQSRAAQAAGPPRPTPTPPISPIILHEAAATMEGRIGAPPHVPRGTNGFGYDPLFLVAPDFTRTGAELSGEEKNILSHRGAAARQIGEWVQEQTQTAP